MDQTSIQILEANVMREAFSQGVVNAVLPIPVMDNVNKKALAYALVNHEKEQHWQLNLYTDARTKRNTISTLPAVEMPDSDDYWLVELAQIPIPDGSIGYLYGIDQFIQDSGSMFYPTGSEYWGVPIHIVNDIGDCRWYLRLDYYDGIIPARINVNNSAAIIPSHALPGRPYEELPEFQDIWYPPHSAASKIPNYVIPGSSILRFFFFCPPTTTYRWQVCGRLRAFVQSVRSKSAEVNTRIVSI